MKKSIWSGFFIALGIYIVIWIVLGIMSSIFISSIPIISVPIAIVGFIVWALIEIFKKENKHFGIGIILGALLPLLVFGACLTIIANSF